MRKKILHKDTVTIFSIFDFLPTNRDETRTLEVFGAKHTNYEWDCRSPEWS